MSRLVVERMKRIEYLRAHGEVEVIETEDYFITLAGLQRGFGHGEIEPVSERTRVVASGVEINRGGRKGGTATDEHGGLAIVAGTPLHAKADWTPLTL